MVIITGEDAERREREREREKNSGISVETESVPILGRVLVTEGNSVDRYQ